MRVIFAGTPRFAAEALRAIIAARHDVPLVLTQPDRPAGRGMQMAMSDVKRLAVEAGIAVEQPVSLRSDAAVETLRRVDAQVMVVAAYGLILPPAVLALSPMPRCCRAGAERRRYSVPSSLAMLRAAYASCRWRRVWIPGRFCARSP